MNKTCALYHINEELKKLYLERSNFYCGTPWNIALIKFHGILNSAKLNSLRWEKLNEISSFVRKRDGGGSSLALPVHVRVRVSMHSFPASPGARGTSKWFRERARADSDISYGDFQSSLHDGMDRGTRDCWTLPRELFATILLRVLSIIWGWKKNWKTKFFCYRQNAKNKLRLK